MLQSSTNHQNIANTGPTGQEMFIFMAHHATLAATGPEGHVQLKAHDSAAAISTLLLGLRAGGPMA